MTRSDTGAEARTAVGFRRRPFPFAAPALLALVAASGCGGGAEQVELVLLDWPGRGGRPVLLDQALVLEFDHRLDQALRAGSFRLTTRSGKSVGPVEFEVNSRHLILYPRLPRLPDLSDGTLRPGTTYRLRLRGVPRLAAVTSPEGPVLLGDRFVEFVTLGRDQPGALAGEAADLGPIQILLPAGVSHYQAAVDYQGWVRIPVEPGLDPRSLRHPALLYRGIAKEPTEIELQLESNTVRRAVLRAKVGVPQGMTVLELPAELEGLGGRRLLESQRRIRLLPLPR